MLSQSQVLEDWTEYILIHTIHKTMSNTTGTYDWSANLFKKKYTYITKNWCHYKNADINIFLLISFVKVFFATVPSLKAKS